MADLLRFVGDISPIDGISTLRRFRRLHPSGAIARRHAGALAMRFKPIFAMLV